MKALLAGSILALAAFAQSACSKGEKKAADEQTADEKAANNQGTDEDKPAAEEGAGEEGSAGEEGAGEEEPAPVLDKPKMTNVLKEELSGLENREVIVSHVQVPPNMTLPKHYHPGEEFLYVLDGSVTIWQKDKEDTVLKKGDVFTVPLKQIHTAMTKDESVTALVFRVHEKGQPIRFNLDEEKKEEKEKKE